MQDWAAFRAETGVPLKVTDLRLRACQVDGRKSHPIREMVAAKHGCAHFLPQIVRSHATLFKAALRGRQVQSGLGPRVRQQVSPKLPGLRALTGAADALGHHRRPTHRSAKWSPLARRGLPVCPRLPTSSEGRSEGHAGRNSLKMHHAVHPARKVTRRFTPTLTRVASTVPDEPGCMSSPGQPA